VSKMIRSIFLALLCAACAGCQTPGDDAIVASTALTNAPQVAPVTFKVTISPDRRRISFIPILRNFGFDDAKKAFEVRMSVTRGSVQIPGSPPTPTVTRENQIIIPDSTVLTGHHGADFGGLEVEGPPTIEGVSYDPLATYDVTIVVDGQKTAFGGANEAISTFTWTGVIGDRQDPIFIANKAIPGLPGDATGWRCNDVPVPDDVWGFRFPISVHPSSSSVCLQTALGGPFYIQQFRRVPVDDAVCARRAGKPVSPPFDMEGWRVCRDPGPLNRGNPPGTSPDFRDKALPCPKVTTGPNGCAPCLAVKFTPH
jgi:hypothetical protein